MLSFQQQRLATSRMLQNIARYLLPAILLISFVLYLPLASPVQAQPSIFPSPLPNGQTGTPYTANMVASGGTPPYTWAVISGALPPGLSLNAAAGVISGVPTAAGTFSFIVRITDSVAASSQQGFFITISAPPLTFLTTSLPSAEEGTPYTASVSVKGGTAPYAYSIVTGSLPSGLTLVATFGAIGGTPDKGTAGTHSFVISVTDSSTPQLTGQQNFSILVEKGAFEPLVVIGSGLKAGETKVIAGGQHVATLRGGDSVRLSLAIGTSATVAVDATVEHPTETGVRFKAEVDRMTVSENSPSIEFPYYTEYQIDLEAEPSDVTQLSGSGWYREGYTLRTSAPEEVSMPDKPGQQYRFSQWVLPTGETQSSRDLKLTVAEPGLCTARYDTYYQLTLVSSYGEPQGSAWYKAGSQVEWKVGTQEVKMSDILGVFGGKLKPVSSAGTILMDSPKTVNVEWQPDYTMPMILIPLAVLLLIAGIYGLYRIVSGPKPKPAQWAPPAWSPPPYMPPPAPPQTTVVLMGEKPKELPSSTKEQLMEKFGELLDKYGDEIKATIQKPEAPELPAADTARAEKSLPAHEETEQPVYDAEFAPAESEEAKICNFTSKRLTRVVAGNWKQTGTRPGKIAPAEEQSEDKDIFIVVWSRDIYQEWEIFDCSLQHGHKGTHEGDTRLAYTVLNTVTEEKQYDVGQDITPPKPHYTDGMPQVDVSAKQIVASDELPD